MDPTGGFIYAAIGLVGVWGISVFYEKLWSNAAKGWGFTGFWQHAIFAISIITWIGVVFWIKTELG